MGQLRGRKENRGEEDIKKTGVKEEEMVIKERR